MPQHIFALSIQLRKPATSGALLELTDELTRALLVNLKCFYQEVFIWSAPSRIGIWVVGSDHDFLIQSFSGFDEAISYMKAFAGDDAKQLFYDIATGKKWRAHIPLVKYSHLCRAETLARLADTVGSHLNDLIRKGQQELLVQPVLYGGRHSWISSISCKDIEENVEHIVYPELFYRFSVN